MRFNKTSGLLVSTLLFIFTLHATSQQIKWEQTQGPVGGIPISMIVGTDGTLYIGTIGGGIFLSSDNGNNWFTHNTGLADRYPYALLEIPSKMLFAGTNDSGIYRSPGLGQPWERVETANISEKITSIVSSDSTIIAGTWSGNIYRSTDMVKHGPSQARSFRTHEFTRSL